MDTNNQTLAPKVTWKRWVAAVAILAVIVGGSGWIVYRTLFARKGAIAGAMQSSAVQAIQQRAGAGDLKSLYDIAYWTHEGRSGVTKDLAKAHQLFKAAADKGYAPAQHYLAECYLARCGDCTDTSEGVRLMRGAADQGDVTAQRLMGQIYFQGRFMPRDFTEALRWYRLAADHGDTKAQYNLGVFFFNGTPPPADPVQGLKWMRLAATNGEHLAQRNLANHYRTGVDGVPVDLAEAERWEKLAQ